MIYLAGRVDARSREICEALTFSPATFRNAIVELREDDYVSATKKGDRNISRYALTEDGLSVAHRLIRYQSYEGQIVQPNRTNKLIGKYEPIHGYQRQCGNKQIRSAGLPC